MNININYSTNFQSKAYPVKSFKIKTQHGKLKFSEVSVKDLRRESFILNLTKFFCKNFASLTKDPMWNAFENPKSSECEQIIENFSKYYNAKIKHTGEDMTLLLAKDKRNKIQGACLSYAYDRIPNCDSVCYIDSIAVNPLYRGSNIGKILLEKSLESAKHKFTDAFLTGDKKASGFYEKLGFKPLDKNDIYQQKIVDYISKRRADYPKYVELFTKPIQDTKTRWYHNIIIED